ncbi:unnamed protein product, partial [Vitis vinifera]
MKNKSRKNERKINSIISPSLGELDAADDGEGDEAGEEGVRDGDDSDGLHGLDRHWDAEEKAGGDVVESREDEGCGEVQMVDQCEICEFSFAVRETDEGRRGHSNR